MENIIFSYNIICFDLSNLFWKIKCLNNFAYYKFKIAHPTLLDKLKKKKPYYFLFQSISNPIKTNYFNIFLEQRLFLHRINKKKKNHLM